MAISDSEFWSWIKRIGWGTRTTDHDAVRRALMTMWPSDYADEFNETLDKMEGRLYKRIFEWEKEAIASGELRGEVFYSDDAISDLISHIVALGKREYDAVMKNPSLAAERFKKNDYTEAFSVAIPSTYFYKNQNITKYKEWAQDLDDQYAKILRDRSEEARSFQRGAKLMRGYLAPLLAGDIAGFIANEQAAKKVSEEMSEAYHEGIRRQRRVNPDAYFEIDGSDVLGNMWAVWNLYSDVRKMHGPGPIMRIARGASLRSKLIRLAYRRPELRRELLPLVMKRGFQPVVKQGPKLIVRVEDGVPGHGSIQTIPTDPYGQVYETALLAKNLNRGTMRGYHAAMAYMRENAAELARKPRLYYAVEAVDEAVKAQGFKPPRWHFYSMPD